MHEQQSPAASPEPFRGPVAWSLDLTTGEMRSSPARARLMGHDPRSVIPTPEWWDRALHPDERLAVQLTRRRPLQGSDSGYRSEYRARRADGAWMWLLEIGCIERDGSSAATGVSGVLLDITGDREAQFRLQQRLERLSTIFDCTYQFTGLLAPDGVLLEINRSALNAVQASRSEALGKPLWQTPMWINQACSETERLRDGVARASRGEFVRFQMRAEHLHGGPARIVDICLLPVLGDDGAVVSILSEGRDVTDILTAQARQAEMRSHVADRLESVGRLAAGVAHEINTPVQFVSDSLHFVRDGLYELLVLTDRMRSLAARDQCNANSVSALSTHLPYLVENLPKALERSLEGLKRVSEIVSSMRDLSHPDRPEMSNIDVNQVVQNALVVARSEYKYVADIQTDLRPLPPVRGHAGELNQVLLNLLVNASHAIGDVVADSRQKGLIKISTRLDGDSVVISVRDSGCGIPADISHRVFEPFFTTKDVGRGTGQGLTISHNIIVKRHGGSIDFDSAIGQGTVFHVRLPYDRQAREQVA